MYLKNARIVKLFISLLFFLAEIKKQWTLAILPVFIEIRLRGIFSEKKKKEITWNVVSVRIIIIIKKKITLLKLYFRNKSERVTTAGSFYNSHAPSGVKCRKQSERGKASSSRFEHQQRVVSRNSLVVERFLPGWRHELSPPGTAFVDNHSSTTSQRYK